MYVCVCVCVCVSVIKATVVVQGKGYLQPYISETRIKLCASWENILYEWLK